MEEGKKHNKKIIWQDFLSYLTRRFTNLEMHHFERKVDKSAFETEALEGLEKFAGASMDNDIELLKDHIHKRNTLFDPKSTTRFTLKNVAAIAVIVVISGILVTLLISRNGKMDEQLAQNMPIPASDSIKEMRVIAQQMQTPEPEANKEIIQKRTLKSENIHSIETTSESTSNKTIMVETLEVMDDEVEETEFIEEDLAIIDNAIELLDTPNKEESEATLDAISFTSSSKTDAALMSDSNSNKTMAVQAALAKGFTVLEVSSQNEIHPETIHPKKGDETFTAQLKKWLQEQSLENAGEIKIKLTFGGNMAPETVSIINGINSDTDKAIQYYILKNTEWVSNAKNFDSGKEYEYSFSL